MLQSETQENKLDNSYEDHLILNELDLECQDESRNITFLEKVTNSYFKIANSSIPGLSFPRLELNTKFSFLGFDFDSGIDSQEASYLISSVLWFSYRTNMPIMTSKTTDKTYISDTGWGCMVRVGQMMFAEVLKRYRINNTENYPITIYRRGGNNLIKEFIEIIKLFLDKKDFNSIFSLRNIIDIAYQEFKIEPGQWHKPASVIYSIENLIANENDFNKLKILVFVDGCVFLNQVVTKMFPNICNDCYTLWKHGKDKPSIDCQCMSNPNSVWISICTKLGDVYVHKEYIEVIKYLINTPLSVGIMGGKPSKALYLFGNQNDSLLFLDPHFVQDADPNIIGSSLIESYLSSDPRLIDILSIDSCLTFGYYLNSSEKLRDFVSLLISGKLKFIDCWPIGIQIEFVDMNNEFNEL